ncbi:hypothetical protein JB92DRAFT_3129250 [Gautieria morchelliformis]|nr:hypothetical protein JB92DRAFT_3129250 [Gautieria morchelliformis]
MAPALDTIASVIVIMQVALSAFRALFHWGRTLEPPLQVTTIFSRLFYAALAAITLDNPHATEMLCHRIINLNGAVQQTDRRVWREAEKMLRAEEKTQKSVSHSATATLEYLYILDDKVTALRTKVITLEMKFMHLDAAVIRPTCTRRHSGRHSA